MSLIKKIKQYINGVWQDLILDSNITDLDALNYYQKSDWITIDDNGIVMNVAGDEVSITDGFQVNGCKYYDGRIIDFSRYNEFIFSSEEDMTPVIGQTWFMPNKSGTVALKEDLKDGFEVEGSLTLPNSPDNPETAVVEGAYSMRQTANAQVTVVDDSDTTVTKITGATVATTNLIPYPFYENSKTTKGVTFTVNSNGSVSVVGTPDDTVTDGLFLTLYQGTGSFLTVGKQYTMSGKVDANAAICYAQMYNSTTEKWEYYYGYNNDTFTWSEAYTQFAVRVKIDTGKTANTTIYPMLNEGDVAKPFSPYFAGLKNSYFKGIKSTGKNLIPYPYSFETRIVQGLTYTVQSDGSIRIKGTSTGFSSITLSSKNVFENGKNYCIGGYVDGKITAFLQVRYTVNNADRFYAYYGNPLLWEENFVFQTFFLVGASEAGKEVDITIYPMLNLGSTALDYEPYKSDEDFMLDEAVELGEWDSINPASDEVTRATKTIVFDGTENWGNAGDGIMKSYYVVISDFANTTKDNGYHRIIANYYDTETADNVYAGSARGVALNAKDAIQVYDPAYTSRAEWKAHLAELYAAGKPLTVAYELATPTTETVEFPTKKYRSWNGGSETIIQGDTDNSTFGAMPTVGQEYFIHENPNEAAKKAYVNNGLAKKLDKTGGTITGSLIVEGKTDTVLSSIVVKNSESSFGLTYDAGDETFKLGLGSVDENNNFVFDEEEGLPITLRDDSSAFTDGTLVKWNSDGNKLSPTNLAISEAGDVTIPGKLIADEIEVYSDDTGSTSIIDAAAGLRVIAADGTVARYSYNGVNYNGNAIIYPNAAGIFATQDWVNNNLNSYIPIIQKGATNGVASLDSNGRVPTSQLPSYVDDVIEADAKVSFPTTGETGKIYVDKTTNKTYRWSGSSYVEISASLALGETSSTAYYGDKGKVAYEHSQTISGNPHKVTKSEVGLGSVINTGDSATPISGGTAKFTTGGAYTELAKKVDKSGGNMNEGAKLSFTLEGGDRQTTIQGGKIEIKHDLSSALGLHFLNPDGTRVASFGDYYAISAEDETLGHRYAYIATGDSNYNDPDFKVDDDGNCTAKSTLKAPIIYENNTALSNKYLAISGTAAKATKLATARTISLGTGVTGTATSFDGSSDITIPVTSVKEAYLSWGGRNMQGTFGPLDASLIPTLGANRFAFMSKGVTFEYSQDGGATWLEYTATDARKINLFTDNGSSFVIGNSSGVTGVDKSSYMFRITIETVTASLYTDLVKFAIHCSTNGSSGSYCTITGRTQKNYVDEVDTWKTIADKVPLGGWDGWNIINAPCTTSNGRNDNEWSSYIRQLRFTFGVTSHASSLTSSGLTILKIFGYGGVGWSTPSTLARIGTIYTYDSGQNVTFPSAVKATSFYEDGTALSSKYLAKNGNAVSATRVTTADGAIDSERKIVVSNESTSGQNLYTVSGVTANYSKGTLTAVGGFNGNLSGNAATATKATQDGDGNNIVNTYATKNALSAVESNITKIVISGDIVVQKAKSDADGNVISDTYSKTKVYASSSGTMQVSTLRIYTDTSGYLHIDTE